MYTLTSYSRNSIPSSPLLREHNKIELGVAKHFVTWAQKLQLRLFHYYFQYALISLKITL